jgi:hypothetical protein
MLVTGAWCGRSQASEQSANFLGFVPTASMLSIATRHVCSSVELYLAHASDILRYDNSVVLDMCVDLFATILRDVIGHANKHDGETSVVANIASSCALDIARRISCMSTEPKLGVASIKAIAACATDEGLISQHLCNALFCTVHSSNK